MESKREFENRSKQLVAESPLSNLTLPIFVNDENRNFWGLATALFAISAYMVTNHFPTYHPTVLPMTWWDSNIPFLPHSVYIYISEYVMFLIAFLLCRDSLSVTKYLYSFTALQVISVFIFAVYPTTFPRELYPLPTQLDWLTFQVFSNLRATDMPTNCAPSLHVSCVYLTSFIFMEDKGKKFPIFFSWATLIALSTLTTKQHYVVDVASGFLLAVFVYRMFYKVLGYRLPETQPNR